MTFDKDTLTLISKEDIVSAIRNISPATNGSSPPSP